MESLKGDDLDLILNFILDEEEIMDNIFDEDINEAVNEVS